MKIRCSFARSWHCSGPRQVALPMYEIPCHPRPMPSRTPHRPPLRPVPAARHAPGRGGGLKFFPYWEAETLKLVQPARPLPQQRAGRIVRPEKLPRLAPSQREMKPVVPVGKKLGERREDGIHGRRVGSLKLRVESISPLGRSTLNSQPPAFHGRTTSWVRAPLAKYLRAKAARSPMVTASMRAS